jgi:pimeloyl-ACP methyl ester carboxylesterase
MAVPALLLHGDSDAIVPLESSQRAAAQIPQSRLAVIHDAGHVPTITSAEEVAAAINDFFKVVPG